MLAALYSIIVEPLVYVVELVFSLSYKVLQYPGPAIVCVSIIVNFLCLPLYSMADAAQQRERDKQKSMEHWVNHIKEHFSGDEQYMMLSTYYRQQGYNQLSQLSSSISLLLQIPIFIAAYRYLSDLDVLQGASFLFVRDLARPDGLLSLGGLTVNVLPILMTVLNVASSAVYTRDLSLRDKLQTYGLAGLFLVLLYNSPSGLVMYWTCNQIFSLFKNLFQKVVPNGRKVFSIVAEVTLAVMLVSLFALGLLNRKKKFVFVLLVIAVAQIPLLAPWADRLFPRLTARLRARTPLPKRKVTASFLLAALLLVVTMGVMVPAALLGSSPAEFVNLNNFINPLSYIVHNTELFFGLFVVWVGIYFFLSDARGREGIALALWCVAGVCLVDYLFFGRNLGLISKELCFEHNLRYTTQEKILNTVAIVVLVAALLAVWVKKHSLVNPILGIMIAGVLFVCVPDVINIRTTVDGMLSGGPDATAAAMRDLLDENGEPLPIYKLSRNGRNVLVLFMDRAIGTFTPYYMEEKPELVQQLDGFVFYPNTLSFGGFTNFGSPALYGGYEYSPEEINKRTDELLRDKQNESIKVMPKVFSDAGFAVTVTDPAYLDYKENTYDYSSLSDIENLKAVHTIGAYSQEYIDDFSAEILGSLPRKFVYYSIFKCAPIVTQRIIYNKGSYLTPMSANANWQEFLDNYSVIDSLDRLAEVTDDSSDNFLLLHSLMTHCPVATQLPDYEPLLKVNNKGMSARSRSAEGMPDIYLRGDRRLNHYHVGMLFMLRLGRYCDWLREQGVYDNTRIIVVSDHGTHGMGLIDDLKFDKSDPLADVMRYNPLFMVKDFGATGFTTSHEFMTNADTPILALDGIVENPVNPYTGKALTSDDKTAHPQLVTTSSRWTVGTRAERPTFSTDDGHWYAVQDDIFDVNNWKLVE